MIPEIDALELAQRLAQPNPPTIIDVREPGEYEYCHIEGAHLKPLDGIMQWSEELDRETEYVLQCHSGVRSRQAANYLHNLGFKHLANLRGGIDAWSVLVDPSVPRY